MFRRPLPACKAPCRFPTTSSKPACLALGDIGQTDTFRELGQHSYLYKRWEWVAVIHENQLKARVWMGFDMDP